MKEIIILIIIISLLSILLFLSLTKIIKSIDNESKEYYFKKVQEIDEELSNRKKELDDKTQLVEEKKESNEKVIKDKIIDDELLDIIKKTDYKNLDALKIAKQVDEIFNIDEEMIIKKFINRINSDNDYKELYNMKNLFNPNFIFNLKNLNTPMQIKMILNKLDGRQKQIFEEYLDRYRFKLNKFLIDLNLLIEINTPYIEVLVGQKNKNYDYLSEYIKTIYSEDIYRGIIIKYQDQIYDYSISERRV